MSAETALAGAGQLRAVGGGSGVVVARDGFTVLIDFDNRGRALEVWNAIGGPGGVDAIIDVLASDGVTSMPGVVVAASEGDRLRVIVRGSVSAEVAVAADDDTSSDSTDAESSGEPVRLDGKNVRSWTETTIEGWRRCRLTIDGVQPDPAVSGDTLCATLIASGVVVGGSVSWDRDAGAGLSANTPAEQANPSPSADQAPPQPAAPATGPVNTPDDPVATSAASPPLTAPTEVVASDPARLTDPAAPAAEAPTIVETIAPAASAIDGDDGSDDPYAAMFGRTVYRDVQAAAVAVADEAQPAEPDNNGPRPSDVSDPPLDSNETRSLADFEGGQSASSAVAAPSPAATGTAEVDGPGDHDGHTMSLAELRRLRPQSGGPANAAPASAGAPVGAGPTVQAVLCSAGHPNPAYASQCRQCGQPVAGATVVVARPSLGWLRASNGDTVELDRPIIVGRNPSLTGRRLSEIPHEWRIANGDGLSRNHAMFHIDGWQVRVEDLGSVNATTVTLPGRDPEMLRAGEPVLITDGAVVDLGGEVTCRYDATI